MDPSIDVLVVGAGPTGLVAAAQLAARGVRCRIVDRLAERSPHSRALAVQARTLELLAKMGLADQLVTAGRRALGGNIYVGRDRVATLNFGTLGAAAEDTAYPFVLLTSEADTERLLEAHLDTLGVRVERSVELAGFTQDAEGVTAEVRSADGRTESVRARYLIGCDGAHSRTREQLKAPFRGAAYAQDFLLADVDVAMAGAIQLSPDEVHICWPDQGLFVLLPLPNGKQRIISAGHDLLPPESAGEPTLADVQAVADRGSPAPLRLSNPAWLARFRLHHRAVEKYRFGRVFLAGDAAHIHSPAGGQGMNTGIQDAYNLAWKLALVVSGDAQPHLLDSYDAERQPVGKQLLRSTDRIFTFAATRNRALLLARKTFAPQLFRLGIQSAAARSYFFRFVSELSLNYRRSPIVGEDFGDGDWRHGPQAGDRAPDGPTLSSDKPLSLHQAMAGTPFDLVYFAGNDSAASVHAQVGEPHTPLVRRHILTRKADPDPSALIDASGLLHHRYGVSHQATYLIRPDGYVAFRAPRIEQTRVAASILRR